MRKGYRFKLGVVFIGICFLLNVDLARAEEAKWPVYESRPKELVVYEGNLAYAKDIFKVYPEDWIQVSLPQTVVTRTLEIIDGKEKVGRFHFVQPASSAEILSVRPIRQPPSPGLSIVKWESDEKKPRKVALSYLLSGISWTPSYAMDILADNKVRLRYNVAISNTALPLSEVNVKLVSGMVGRIQEAEEMYRRRITMAQAVDSEFDVSRSRGIAALPTIGATRINAYYTYELEQIKTLEKGISYVTLLDEELEAEKEFVWLTSAGEKVDVIYTVKNSTQYPFAAGIVETYQKDTYMGSDMIEWTPSASKGHVTIGGAVDIQVKKSVNVTEEPERGHTDEYHHEVELKVENFSKKDIKIKVIDNKYPDCVDIAFSLKPAEEKAMTYMWERELKTGESKTIKYDFYSDNTYYEPYRAYR